MDQMTCLIVLSVVASLCLPLVIATHKHQRELLQQQQKLQMQFDTLWNSTMQQSVNSERHQGAMREHIHEVRETLRNLQVTSATISAAMPTTGYLAGIVGEVHGQEEQRVNASLVEQTSDLRSQLGNAYDYQLEQAMLRNEEAWQQAQFLNLDLGVPNPGTYQAADTEVHVDGVVLNPLVRHIPGTPVSLERPVRSTLTKLAEPLRTARPIIPRMKEYQDLRIDWSVPFLLKEKDNA